LKVWRGVLLFVTSSISTAFRFEKVKGQENCYEFKAWDDEQGCRFFDHYQGEVFVIDESKRGSH
jgi:hypothetical protein